MRLLQAPSVALAPRGAPATAASAARRCAKLGRRRAAPTAAVPATESLYDRLGGAAAVQAVVDIFYDRLYADADLNYFFEGIDRQKLRGHQVHFMTFAFGGPAEYGGRSMRAAHEKLILEKGLNPGHFDLVAGHLIQSLTAAGVSQDKISEVVTIVSSVKPDMFAQSGQAVS